MHSAGMIYGYTRVSTDEQDLAIQLDKLRVAGCENAFHHKEGRSGPIGCRGSSRVLVYRSFGWRVVRRTRRRARGRARLLAPVVAVATARVPAAWCRELNDVGLECSLRSAQGGTPKFMDHQHEVWFAPMFAVPGRE